MTLIKVKSDNYNGLLTPEEYEELVLTMSTGDYCTHEAKPFVIPSTDDRAIEAIDNSQLLLNELNEEL